MKKSLPIFFFVSLAVLFGQDNKLAVKPGPAPPQKKTIITTPKITPVSAPAPKPAELTVKNIIDFVEAGLSEDIIIAKIKKNNKAFDLSAEELLKLKGTKVSENVILLLMDPTAQPKVAPPSPPLAASKPEPAPVTTLTTMAPPIIAVPPQPKKQDSVIAHVPEQAGMYYLNGTELVRVDLKTMASSKVAGRLGNKLTFGIKSVKTNAYLIGPSAKTRMKDTSPVFYLRLSENGNIDEVVLVSLYVKTDRRELEVSAVGGIVGSKQGLRMEVMKPFDSQELAPRLYKIVTSIIGRGEYLFYLVGSADAIKGVQGKGYDFGVD